jgi:molybdate/tungstate transport system substrate-binding protein
VLLEENFLPLLEKKMKNKFSLIFIFSFVFFFLACQPVSKNRKRLVIFHAGSLALPFQDLGKAFKEKNPEVKILREISGSRLVARKISELGKKADLIAVSDYTVIEELLFPDWADWYLLFARNEMVIAYTDQSQFKDEITEKNWYQILLRPGVRYGRGDENLDPCGYRTLLLWKLAEIYYQPSFSLFETLHKNCPPRFIRGTSEELLPLLNSGEIDYAFEYLSVAKQHQLKYLSLPPEINLGKVKHSKFYQQVEVKIEGKKKGSWSKVKGKPIVYALTIPKGASSLRLAQEFIEFLISRRGQQIIKKNYQTPISPPMVKGEKIPTFLKKFKSD